MKYVELQVWHFLIIIGALLTFAVLTALNTHGVLGPPPSTNKTNTNTANVTTVSLPDRAARANVTVFTETTAMSQQDALIGHQMHQAVIVLPTRADGKLWTGSISWTASKPVELRLLYDYNSSLVTDADHGRPITAPLALSSEPPHIPVGEVAISLIKPFNGPPIVSSFNSGTMTFVAKSVALHTVNGDKFTVTYAVDAVARQASK